MTSEFDKGFAKRVVDWIVETARTLNISVDVVSDGMEQNGGWINVPVAVTSDGDAYDRASWLQSIEDLWEPEQFGGLRLFLMPARTSEPAKQDFYEGLGNLMNRQHVLLDRMGDLSVTERDKEPFQVIQREWEETLIEMGRILPSIRSSVL